jgi:hypothetical protein
MHESENDFISTIKKPILSVRTISFIAFTLGKSIMNIEKNWRLFMTNYLGVCEMRVICKQVVTNLFTSCRQVLFALFVPSCCNKFGTNCEQLVRLVTRLFWQIWCSHDITRLLQDRRHNIVVSWLYIGVVGTILQSCYKLLTACSKLVDNLEQTVRTQLADKLLTDLVQDVRFLRVYRSVVNTD